ncbi:hypothetical protein GOTRE_037_00410 [Gordonia terrae NBRC 100016]|uniref:Transposase n=1 Tax=Gordonia terrae NBRC 100016 TaxID=1089454 RepID=A0ABQ0HB12_9ACTN|nr:hypothetical protein GOTRE_037_00410 [Gordonia terrae NBRC 100016]
MGTSVERKTASDLAVGSTAFVTVDTRYERRIDGVNSTKAQETGVSVGFGRPRKAPEPTSGSPEKAADLTVLR